MGLLHLYKIQIPEILICPLENSGSGGKRDCGSGLLVKERKLRSYQGFGPLIGERRVMSKLIKTDFLRIWLFYKAHQ